MYFNNIQSIPGGAGFSVPLKGRWQTLAMLFALHTAQ